MFLLSFKLIYLWLCWVFIALRTFLWLWQAGASLVSVCGLLIEVASLAVEQRLGACRLLQLPRTGSTQLRLPDSRAQAWWLWHRGWGARQRVDLPGLGIEPLSPVLAGRFFTPEPPQKPPLWLLIPAFSHPVKVCDYLLWIVFLKI